ncbi:MAG: hypothetical protein KJ858_03395, partial [Nanoarchaeota archaeon]|nr:hypothetical protein [Nanoarchaeota archaeon]
MIDIAIVGYGNVGRGVHKAIQQNNDMNLVGIVSRNPQRVFDEGVSDVPLYPQQGVL